MRPRPRSALAWCGMPSALGMLMPAIPATVVGKTPLHLQSTQNWVLPASNTALQWGRLGFNPLSISWPVWERRAGALCSPVPPNPPPVPFAGTGPVQAGGALPLCRGRGTPSPSKNAAALWGKVGKHGAVQLLGSAAVPDHALGQRRADPGAMGCPQPPPPAFPSHRALPVWEVVAFWRPAGSRVPGTAGTPPAWLQPLGPRHVLPVVCKPGGAGPRCALGARLGLLRQRAWRKPVWIEAAGAHKGVCFLY